MITSFVAIFDAIRNYGRTSLFRIKIILVITLNIYTKLVNKVIMALVIYKFTTEYSPIYDLNTFI
jgi:hypothetical protein